MVSTSSGWHSFIPLPLVLIHKFVFATSIYCISSLCQTPCSVEGYTAENDTIRALKKLSTTEKTDE